jgi:aminoglycoside phosphotransferase (APT) family kinase protein
VHGDYRLDNLMFATAKGGAKVAAVDWQTLGIGSGGRDLAFLLGNSSPVEQRRRHEAGVLEAYRKAMDVLGVSLSPEEVRQSYAHGSFQGPLITILGSFAVGQTDRGDAMFLAMAERCAAQIADVGAFALVG